MDFVVVGYPIPGIRHVVLWSSSWCCRLCCPFAVVVVLSRLLLCCRRRRCCVGVLLPRRLGCDDWICWRWGRVGSVGWNRMEGRKRTTTFVVAHFLDALCGPPTFWVPPWVLPSPIRPSRKNEPAHIPTERGGAWAVGLRGRGALLVVGGKNEVRSTVDAVDLQLKLRFDLQ